MKTTLILVITAIYYCQLSLAAKPAGICYGLNGDNLASPAAVVKLYQDCEVKFMRLFEPRQDVLEALRDSGICLAIGPRNEDLQNLGSNQAAATAWVNAYVGNYNDICYTTITLGNEAIPGQYAAYIPQAMVNVKNALVSIGRPYINVTTVLAASTLATSYPPSAGQFTPDITELMTNLARTTTSLASPVMINVYPYFAYASEPQHVSLDYALFKSTAPVVTDGPFQYFNLLDATVDAFYAAFEKVGHAEVELYVAETGWPSAGNDPYTSKEYAQTYNANLLSYLSKQAGTPRRPVKPLEAFIFALFNENLKPAGVEQNFGLFYPDLQPVYPFC